MNRELNKKMAYLITKPISFKVMRRLSGEKFIFPFYHLIAEKTPSFIKHLYNCLTPLQFVSDLEFLLKNYAPASVDDLKNYIGNEKKSDKPLFFLSFDDGLKECFEVIYPILKEKGIPAAFFINTGFVDNMSMFYRFKTSLIVDKIWNEPTDGFFKEVAGYLNICTPNRKTLEDKVLSLDYSDSDTINHVGKMLEIDFEEVLKREKPYMTLDQVKELGENGFIIGSHSIDHPVFSALKEQAQIEQFEKSMHFISANFNPEINAFAFPFTDDGISASFMDYMNNSGKVDVTFGTAGIKHDSSPVHIQRIPMEVENGSGANRIIGTEYAYYLLKSLFGRNIIKR
jgi:peptidoglycan/xylan/chitin deacetylase (PgdA/CDA1 family)